MKIIDVKQGSPEWHALRRTHIGASECAAIMGQDPYKSAYQIWRNKVFGEPTVDNYAMKQGRELEPVARKLLEEIMGIEFPPVTCISEGYPWMMASLDGLSAENTVLEIKCPLEATFSKLMANDGLTIPATWQWQIQHQLCVTNLKKAILFVYNESKSVQIEVPRDEDMISQLIEKEGHFWHQYVLKFERPPYEADEVEKRIDVDWIEKADKWQRAKRALLDAEAVEESARNELIDATDGRNTEGGGVKVTKYSRQGNVDYKSIPELQDVDLEPYRKPSTVSWRVS